MFIIWEVKTDRCNQEINSTEREPVLTIKRNTVYYYYKVFSKNQLHKKGTFLALQNQIILIETTVL